MTERFTVAKIEAGVASLVGFTDIQAFEIPISLLPVGVKVGQVINLKAAVEPNGELLLNQKVLQLQDDIAVFLRSSQQPNPQLAQ